MRRQFLKVACGALASVCIGNSAATRRKSTIIQSKCVGCGDCVRACPVKAITLKQGKAWVDQKVCVGCRLCIMTCSYGAPK